MQIPGISNRVRPAPAGAVLRSRKAYVSLELFQVHSGWLPFEPIRLIADMFQLYLVGQSQPPPPQKSHPPRHAAPAPNAQRSRQQAPPPPQHKTSYPHRPAPQPRDACPPRNSYGPSGNAAGQTRGQPSYNSNGKQRAAPPRPKQKSQTLDFEIEEPDGRSYVVRGEATWRDFDPARDKVRKTG